MVTCVLGGCIDSNATTCPAITCPEGALCATRTITDEVVPVCATQSQLDACTDHAAGDTCSLAAAGDGTCHDGLCWPTICGNGVVDNGEVCDDGNTRDSVDGVPDSCASNCRSTQVCGNGVVEPINSEECDTGDAIQHDGCSSGCRIEVPRFGTLDSVNSLPSFGLAYDTDRERPVMFGGYLDNNANTDIQEWVHGHWQRAPSPVTPPILPDFMAYDRDHHELVLYGTQFPDGGNTDTWTRDVHGWRLREPTVAPDVTVEGIVFDANHHRVVMVGTHRTSNAHEMQTWIWDGADWSPLATPMVARDVPAVAYDERRGVVVMFGGGPSDSPDPTLDELWELDGDSWTQVPHAFGASWPAGMSSATMSYDPTPQHMVLIGRYYTQFVAHAAAWEWDGSTWTAVAAPPGIDRASVAMVTDLTRKRLFLTITTNVVQVVTRAADGAWISESNAVPHEDNVPYNRSLVAAASDPQRGEVVVFGGGIAPDANNFPHVYGVLPGDTFVWRDSWRMLPASSSSPLPRVGASMVFDPVHDEYVMFGGYDGFNGVAFLDDTWTFKAGQWTQRTPTTKPQGRMSGAMAWDNRRGRVILLGGRDRVDEQGTPSLAGMWSWDGSEWTSEPLTSEELPPLRSATAIAYDPLSNNVVLYGGCQYDATFAPLRVGSDDTWIWDGTSWTQPPLTVRPPPRTGGKLAWNLARQRLEMFGGASTFQTKSDVWEWNGNASEWKRVAIVGPETSGHELVSLPDGTGVAVIGGGRTDYFSDHTNVRTLRWESDDGREEACVPGVDFDGDGKTGCDDPDCWVDCNIDCPLATSCTTGPRCGDGTCNDTGERESEDCVTCPVDCGACT